MLRTYFVQQWFNLSDPGVEEALYESAALRRFVSVDLGMAPAPDETTICRLRHLLEKHDLGGLMLEAVNVHLEAKGIRIATGTIVDATIIHAPCSTKNQSGERDPEMHQTRKGNQWYFGLKAHIGVDSKEGVVHSQAAETALEGSSQPQVPPKPNQITPFFNAGSPSSRNQPPAQTLPSAHLIFQRWSLGSGLVRTTHRPSLRVAQARGLRPCV